MGLSRAEIVELNRRHVLMPWAAQATVTDPIVMERGKGVYFWDVDGTRYLDFSSALMNLQIGHGDQRVTAAVVAQMERFSYASTGVACESRSLAAAKLASLTPGDLNCVFFTPGGGADAISNAIKMARMITGRHKIVTRYRSYHGSTGEADAAGGDPRRLSHEPGNPGIIRVMDPFPYRCPFGYAPEGNLQAYIDHVEQTVRFEGPKCVAAILMEPVTGTSGLIIPPRGYWKAMREIADHYGILLIADEVMSGFGRTGKMFATEHDEVVPDILVLAKGLTCGYLPLGAVVLRDKIATHFDGNVLWCGHTYANPAVSCAAAVATMEIYESDGLVDKSRRMGEVMAGYLADMKHQHPCVGDVRSIGLFGAIELVRDRKTREPLSEWNMPMTEPMKAIAAAIRALGMYTFVRWNIIYVVPPLVINTAELAEGFRILNEVLKIGDQAVAA